jgi:peptidoglycan/LPS O-acetylase OafA/YrhL/lysophospholipase L1-like esterase
MKRSASLDFLRGSAAFAVAIPHYLTTNARFQPLAEAVAISGVEVFFVLSGFVLAPQIVDWVIGKPWRNLGVFLARRWMRTIPPYVVALVVVALMTGELMTADFLRYLFYVENLFRSANHTDFYPVAWSLAVEEWFYVLFAPLLFLVGRMIGRSDRRMDVAFAGFFILVMAALRLLFVPHDWDLDVRRVTLFRIDSIVWGYLLYLTMEKRLPLAFERGPGLPLRATRRPRTIGLLGRFTTRNSDHGFLRRLPALGALAVVATAFELWVALLAVRQIAWAQTAFPYASALFGAASVGFFRQADQIFKGRRVAAVSFYLGRISYSAYLFHIIIVMALKPRIADWPLAAQVTLYLAIVCAFSTLFWRGFERPLLAARPDYVRRRFAPVLSSAPSRARDSGRSPSPVRGRKQPREASPDGGRRSPFSLASFALALASLLAATLARNAFMANEPYLFYPALVAAAVLAMALAERAGRRAGGLGTAARAFFLFALALPVADAFYRSSTGVPLAASIAAPTYSYRAARQNPAAFATWWFYYLNEWIRDDGIRGAIEKPDAQKKLPFVLIPGSWGRMFDATVRINAAGFRGPELAREKGDRFRIFALGESQTFGPTLREGDKPWPELLQGLFDQHASCGRPVEVVNAGTEAYTLEDNLERMRRDILPLKPDLILSTHGLNGYLALGLRQQAEPNEPGVRPRASALIGRAVLTIERGLHDWRTRSAPRPTAPPPLPDEALMKSRYAEAYRKLIALSQENGVPVVLATASMAVDEASPREVKDFYGAVFKPIDDIIAASAAHNRMVKLLAHENGVPLIDVTRGLDGVWDDDLYLDIVHFTERGHERVAAKMFQALVQILASEGLSCTVSSRTPGAQTPGL